MPALPSSFRVTVEAVKPESPDTVTLFFEAPRGYRAGQYLSIAPQQFAELEPLRAELEGAKGRREAPRKYSMSSAPHEPRVAITVKEEEFIEGRTAYRPLMSGFLARGLAAGSSFDAFGYAGPYVLPEALEPGRLIVHVVAGSGAVPNFSILKDALHRGLDVRHVWVASNKTRADVLFRDQLVELKRAHPDRFVGMVDTLTRERVDGFRFGRISDLLLHEVIDADERASCLVFACGPAVPAWERRAALESGGEVTPRFMETVLGSLHAMGVDDRRIRRETYG
jgi:ferredoxin-NADP reductase